MKKLLFLGVLVTLAGAGVVGYGMWAQQKQNEEDLVRWQETQQVTRLNDFVDKFNGAKSKDDYRILEAGLSKLPKKHQDLMGPQIKLKLAVFDFEEAEDLLDRARGLQQSLTVPQPPPPPAITHYDHHGQPVHGQPPAPPVKIHPAAMAMFEKAVPLYHNAKKEMDRLSEAKGDADYNFRLNYIKGEVYHRYTQLFATQETAKELFNQTVTYYKTALRYKPADINTVINIELLIRDEQGMGGAGQPQQQRNKLLNQQPGSGRSKGH